MMKERMVLKLDLTLNYNCSNSKRKVLEKRPAQFGKKNSLSR